MKKIKAEIEIIGDIDHSVQSELDNILEIADSECCIGIENIKVLSSKVIDDNKISSNKIPRCPYCKSYLEFEEFCKDSTLYRCSDCKALIKINKLDNGKLMTTPIPIYTQQGCIPFRGTIVEYKDRIGFIKDYKLSKTVDGMYRNILFYIAENNNFNFYGILKMLNNDFKIVTNEEKIKNWVKNCAIDIKYIEERTHNKLGKCYVYKFMRFGDDK